MLRILFKANIKRLLERLLLFDNGQGKRVRGNSGPGESVLQCFAKKPLFSAFRSTTTLAKEKLVKSLKVREDGKAQERPRFISLIIH